MLSWPKNIANIQSTSKALIVILSRIDDPVDERKHAISEFMADQNPNGIKPW